jgi:hypothetical protein
MASHRNFVVTAAVSLVVILSCCSIEVRATVYCQTGDDLQIDVSSPTSDESVEVSSGNNIVIRGGPGMPKSWLRINLAAFSDLCQVPLNPRSPLTVTLIGLRIGFARITSPFKTTLVALTVRDSFISSDTATLSEPAVVLDGFPAGSTIEFVDSYFVPSAYFDNSSVPPAALATDWDLAESYTDIHRFGGVFLNSTTSATAAPMAPTVVSFRNVSAVLSSYLLHAADPNFLDVLIAHSRVLIAGALDDARGPAVITSGLYASMGRPGAFESLNFTLNASAVLVTSCESAASSPPTPPPPGASPQPTAAQRNTSTVSSLVSLPRGRAKGDAWASSFSVLNSTVLLGSQRSVVLVGPFATHYSPLLIHVGANATVVLGRPVTQGIVMYQPLNDHVMTGLQPW